MPLLTKQNNNNYTLFHNRKEMRTKKNADNITSSFSLPKNTQGIICLKKLSILPITSNNINKVFVYLVVFFLFPVHDRTDCKQRQQNDEASQVKFLKFLKK